MNPFSYSACQGKTLLLVDDDAQNRDLIVDLLLQHIPNMTVLVAKNGLQALTILSKKTVDVVLLDWEMPEMDGIQFLEHLQAHPLPYLLPIVMHTGAMLGSVNLALALEKGAVDFLRKPSDPVELFARLNNTLQQKALEEQRQRAIQAENRQLKQELTQQLLVLAQKNEALLEIQATAEQLAQSKETVPRSFLNAIQRLLERDDYWEDFLAKFNRSEPLFAPRLLALCPDLSAAELRMAVLIRLGLDMKTVAHLLHISNEGVKKSRYRLRKKLNLEQEEGLEVFLMQVV